MVVWLRGGFGYRCRAALGAPQQLPAALVTLVPSQSDQARSFRTEEVLQRSSQQLVFAPCKNRHFSRGTVQLVFSFKQGTLLQGIDTAALPWHSVVAPGKPGFAPPSKMESGTNAVGPHQDAVLDHTVSCAARQLAEGLCPPGAQLWQSPVALAGPRAGSAAPSTVPFQPCSSSFCCIFLLEFAVNEHKTRSCPYLLLSAG